MSEQPEQFERRYPERTSSERRTGDRRKSSRLYWLIGALFLAFVLTLVLPALHTPMWVRFVLLVIIAGLCVVDRRGLTLRHFAVMCGLFAVGCGCLFAAAWHTQQAVLYGVLTAVFAIFSLALFNVKSDQRVR